MVILLVTFGSVLTMGLPIGTTLFGIGTGIAVVLITRNAINMPNFTTSAVAMVGLGVGTSYALFIVTLPREPRHGSRSRAGATTVSAMHRGTRGVVHGHHRDHLVGLLLMKTTVMHGAPVSGLDRRVQPQCSHPLALAPHSSLAWAGASSK